MIDPYTVLGVPKGASQADIKKAYRTQLRLFHPDTNPSQADTDAFAQLRAAYDHILYGMPYPQPSDGSSHEDAQDDWPHDLPYDVEAAGWAAVHYRDAIHDAFTSYRTSNDENIKMLIKAHSALAEDIHQLDLATHKSMTAVAQQVGAGTVKTAASFDAKMQDALLSQGLQAPDRIYLAGVEFESYHTDRQRIITQFNASLEKALSDYEATIRTL